MPVTFAEEQLEQWVAEVEEGYVVDELKKRGRDRPGRAADPTHVVAVRLSTDEREESFPV
ncbi:MAG: hypothetical protein MR654_06285 [Corynebacterium glucuronolyticum]|nr:hypothetical protein [Corynebacterium glucuronolyticum]